MENQIDIDTYATACVGCFKHTTALAMFPHRENGYLVGWVFACPKCFNAVAGGEINFVRDAPYNNALATELLPSETIDHGKPEK